MFRIIQVIMLLLLLLSVAVQYNDPDPLLWMLIYGYALLFTLLAVSGVYTTWSGLVAILYFAGFVYWMPAWDLDTWMLLKEPKMSSEAVEEVREAVGVLICAVWMAALTVLPFRRTVYLENREPRAAIEEPRHGEQS